MQLGEGAIHQLSNFMVDFTGTRDQPFRNTFFTVKTLSLPVVGNSQSLSFPKENKKIEDPRQKCRTKIITHY